MVQARKQQQQLSRELANGQRAEAGGATDKAWRDGKRAEQAETSELLRAMLLSRGERTSDGRPTTGHCPALYPHWRHFVPRHIPLNQWSLRELLGLRQHAGGICNPKDTIRDIFPAEVRQPSYLAGGAADILATDKRRNDELKAAHELMREAREAAAAAAAAVASGGKASRKRPASGGPTTSKARKGNVAAAQGPTVQPPKKRTPPRGKHERANEARRVLHAMFDLSELHQPHLVCGSATTNGYGIYFHIHRSGRTQPDELLAPALKAAADAAPAGKPPAAPPRRGQPPTGRFYSVDELKAWGLTLEDLHFLGVDPGKRDLAHVASHDQPDINCRATAARRRQELAAPRCARKRDEASKTEAGQHARRAVDALARTSSTSVDLQTYHGHASSRVGTLAITLGFYAEAMFRNHRRKTRFKMQRWENKLVAAIRTMAREADPTGEKVIVLAYGSWGATAGRAGSPVNSHQPPTLGAGLMRMLARHFVVVVTPESYTTKVCHECQGDKCCGRWAAQEAARGGREIRGVRFCTKCQRPWGRDHNAALNIAINCVRLWEGEPLVGPQATDEEAELAACEERLGAPDREGLAGEEDVSDGPRA